MTERMLQCKGQGGWNVDGKKNKLSNIRWEDKCSKSIKENKKKDEAL